MHASGVPVDLELRHDEERQRYVAVLAGEPVGLAAYRLSGQTIVFTHTEVDDEVEGRGIGTALIAYALADARRRGLHIVPLCPFVAAHLVHHPEQADRDVTETVLAPAASDAPDT